MRKKIISILKYIVFLGFGVFVFWWVYKDENIEDFVAAFRSLNYFWIIVSVFLSILSMLSRAIRWNMLIQPMGYNPRLINSFLSVLAMYFVNLLLPRAGEVFRCTVLDRYEKIPFSKLLGTVFVERMADFIMLMLLAVIIIAMQSATFIDFFRTHPEIGSKLTGLFTSANIVAGVVILALLIVIAVLSVKYFKNRQGRTDGKLIQRLRKLKYNLLEGVSSILSMENKWKFIGHTLFIFTLWLLMLYAVFLAFEPTSHLPVSTGMMVFMMGGLAMLAPVQGGIGPWHFMVYETLFLYGIEKTDGKIFALIAHTSTNLIYLLFGIFALMILPLVNSRPKPD